MTPDYEERSVTNTHRERTCLFDTSLASFGNDVLGNLRDDENEAEEETQRVTAKEAVLEHWSDENYSAPDHATMREVEEQEHQEQQQTEALVDSMEEVDPPSPREEQDKSRVKEEEERDVIPAQEKEPPAPPTSKNEGRFSSKYASQSAPLRTSSSSSKNGGMMSLKDLIEKDKPSVEEQVQKLLKINIPNKKQGRASSKHHAKSTSQATVVSSKGASSSDDLPLSAASNRRPPAAGGRAAMDGRRSMLGRSQSLRNFSSNLGRPSKLVFLPGNDDESSLVRDEGVRQIFESNHGKMADILGTSSHGSLSTSDQQGENKKHPHRREPRHGHDEDGVSSSSYSRNKGYNNGRQGRSTGLKRGDPLGACSDHVSTTMGRADRRSSLGALGRQKSSRNSWSKSSNVGNHDNEGDSVMEKEVLQFLNLKESDISRLRKERRQKYLSMGAEGTTSRPSNNAGRPSSSEGDLPCFSGHARKPPHARANRGSMNDGTRFHGSNNLRRSLPSARSSALGMSTVSDHTPRMQGRSCPPTIDPDFQSVGPQRVVSRPILFQSSTAMLSTIPDNSVSDLLPLYDADSPSSSKSQPKDHFFATDSHHSDDDSSIPDFSEASFG